MSPERYTVSWEVQGKVRRYTRSFRQNGRVVRQYIGTGPGAEFVAAADLVARAAREREAAARKAERATWEVTSETLSELESIAKLAVKSSLLVAGYYQNPWGHWRRRQFHA